MRFCSLHTLVPLDDTRILREQGMAMVPVGRSLLECTEMADHFSAFLSVMVMAGRADCSLTSYYFVPDIRC